MTVIEEIERQQAEEQQSRVKQAATAARNVADEIERTSKRLRDLMALETDLLLIEPTRDSLAKAQQECARLGVLNYITANQIQASSIIIGKSNLSSWDGIQISGGCISNNG